MFKIFVVSYFIFRVFYKLEIVAEVFQSLRPMDVNHKKKLQAEICSSRFETSYGVLRVAHRENGTVDADLFEQKAGGASW